MSDKYSPKEIASRMKYIQKKYDTISIRQPKGWKDRVKGAAEKAGMSLAGFIREAVDEKMERNE